MKKHDVKRSEQGDRRPERRLALNRESLRTLTHAQLSRAGGGAQMTSDDDPSGGGGGGGSGDGDYSTNVLTCG